MEGGREQVRGEGGGELLCVWIDAGEGSECGRLRRKGAEREGALINWKWLAAEL